MAWLGLHTALLYSHARNKINSNWHGGLRTGGDPTGGGELGGGTLRMAVGMRQVGGWWVGVKHGGVERLGGGLELVGGWGC